MTIRTESRLTVAGSVDDVWGYLCDVGRWAEWAPTVLACEVRGGGVLQAGGWIDQRARDFGWNHRRSERVTLVDSPRSLAFAGTMGTSVARWGMEFAAVDGGHTDTMMWVEIDRANVMRAIPARTLESQVQHTSDIEMAAIKAAVEADAGEP
ncbi:SRPBCC family protein [Microbacterium sp. ASV49]|uniref:SRPBCC family protein n=1 Tax=Microbacterium candidum TaxID=3041922 RepID=A0ABT7N2N6_9MICO|nr:SRPBCC family protein [Microbacterium sp. ASV49]MDL9980973.1 SRPBCC family protein [Microbacterium sp. ASV49]